MNELRANVKQLSLDEKKTEIEIITMLQSAAASTKNEKLLGMLCELKWEYV